MTFSSMKYSKLCSDGPDKLLNWTKHCTLTLHLQLPANSTVTLDALKYVPTFFWWVPDEHVDIVLDVVAYVGIALSCILMFQGSGNVFIFIILRVFYHSLVYVGQVWYAFGKISFYYSFLK